MIVTNPDIKNVIKGNTDKTKCINNTIHAVNNIMFNVVRESSHLACHIGDFKKSL